MPDWLAHVLAAAILWKLLIHKFNFDSKFIPIIMVGALIPDAEKMGLLLYVLAEIDIGYFLKPLHSIFGSILLAGIISLFFYDSKRIMTILCLGIGTHLSLDLLMSHITGGEILLLFPFSFNMYQLNLIQTDNYYPALITVLLAFLIIIYERISRHKKDTSGSS
jgi:hypothetical protein|tara:strand:+ start:44 stop:535 length:492 start_codon:yes stop_codon:yes gene_type:complete